MILTESFICACFLAALSDIRLPNGNTTTLTFSPRFPTATFDVEVICDGIVEFNQSCTLEFDPIKTADVMPRGGLTVDQGRGFTEVQITDCEDDCEFVQFLADLSECRL